MPQRSRIQVIWDSMIGRCHRSSHRSYSNYGKRGISVCDIWRHSSKDFVQWAIENGYEDDKQIDRIDGTKGYSPDNCRWVTRTENQRNIRTNVNLTAFGETKCISAWFEDSRRASNISYGTIQARIRDGWEHERAITALRFSKKNS